MSEGRTWDAAVRWFHWINALAVFGLGSIGTVILFGGDLGLSDDGKVALKTLHVLIGYLFLTNLLVRFGWAFVGGDNARWRNLLPIGKGFLGELRAQLRNFGRAAGHRYPGHSPLGRISIALMLLSLAIMGTTGLVLAGTDIYYPPFGGWIAEWIAAPGVDPSTLVPYRPELVDESSYEAMRAFRAPFKEVHEYTFFVLLALVPLHLAGVVVAELKGGGALVSAMISGRRAPAGDRSESR